MKKRNSNYNPSSMSSVISMVVLLGFLCIQFHSFSHIDLSFLSDNKKTHQTENASSQILELPPSDREAALECPNCVLNEHLQAYIEQDGVLFLSNALKSLTTSSDESLFESSKYLFHLRAPPFHIV